MNIKTDKTPAQMVEEYVVLRNAKAVADERYKEFVKEHYGDPMELLEAQLLDVLNKLGIDSIAGKSGTAYKKLTTSVTIADAREFRRHVIGTEEWDLIDWRANKTAVNALVEDDQPLPPGVNRTAFYSVGIRKPK